MAKEQYVIYNLERFFPTVEFGIDLIKSELQRCRKQNIVVIKIIHGYGSSGRGGQLRLGVRRFLQELLQKGSIQGISWGENFSIFDETTRKMLEMIPELRRDTDLEQSNHGITMVLL